MGARVDSWGLGEADGDGEADGLAGASVVVTVMMGVGVLEEPGALAVKKVDDADAPAPGVPEPVQAETASAANTVTVLQRTAAHRVRNLVRPTQRNRMKPPDVTAALRLFPRTGLCKPVFEQETAGPA